MADPYDPPHADYGSTGSSAPPEPSGIAKSMGILSIVFGSLVVLVTAALMALNASGTQLKFGNPDPGDIAAATQIQHELAPYQMTIDGMMFAMSIALIVIGAGLVKQRGGARLAAIYWSIAGFVVIGIRAWIEERKIWPRMEPFMRSMIERQNAHQKALGNPTLDAATLGNIGHAAEYGKLAVYALFPALLLLLLNLPSVRERLRTT